MQHYLTAMRPKQWTKNLFIFAGIIFSGNLFNSTMLLKVFGCFVVFCLISGAVYLINDICDLEKDKKHPKKKHRPLPAGLISVRGAGTAAVLLTVSALSLAFFLSVSTGIITAVYFVLMLLYSFYIKKFIILDVFTIALGFVLRVVAGVEVINVYLSPWAVMCTFFLALFLALGKRRNEKIILGDTASEHRDSLDMYTIALIDQMISIVATSTIVSYFLYTFKAGQHLSSMITIPFVLFGLFRYLFLVYNENSGGSPEDIIIGDRPLQLAVILWGAVSMGLLYWG